LVEAPTFRIVALAWWITTPARRKISYLRRLGLALRWDFGKANLFLAQPREDRLVITSAVGPEKSLCDGLRQGLKGFLNKGQVLLGPL
jgi:hypothetical protein